MGLWPFGKKDKPEGDDDLVDLASRVVTAVLGDGTRVRGKLVVRFREMVSPDAADRTLSAAVAHVERAAVRAGALAELASSELTARILEELPENVAAARSLELVALHHLDEPAPPSTVSPRSSAPPKPASEPPPKPASQPPPKPSSKPPAKAAEPPAAQGDQPPASVAAPPSRRPSGQMLIARGARLVPFGATPEAAGKALAPLMRDAATKLELAVLRVYDLLVVRGAEIDPADTALAEAMVPVSTAPLGFFAESRSDELARWEKTLGEASYDGLHTEVCAMVSFLLYDALRHAEVDSAIVTTVLERMTDAAFAEGKAAVASLGRYLHPADGAAMSELVKGVVAALGHETELARAGATLTPVVAALQEDLSVAAAQVRSGVAAAKT